MVEKSEPLVSIIIPIYNIERFIDKCVNSITNQTYKRVEIILVDDGSKDNCPQVCDGYKEKDSRIVVIHKPNGGLSDARNAGIDAATGDFITFIDGDDWYEPDAIEKMVSAAQEHNADIVAMGAAIVSSDYENIKYETPELRIESSSEYFAGICKGSRTPSMCTKLFSRSIIGEQRFLKGRLNEDFYFILNLLFQGCKVATINYVGYYYYQREGSITHSGSKKSLGDAIQNCIDLMGTASKRTPAFLPYIARMGLHQSSVMIRVIPEKRVTRDNKYLQLTQSCISLCYPYLSKCKLSILESLIVISARIAPVFTARVLKVLRLFRQ